MEGKTITSGCQGRASHSPQVMRTLASRVLRGGLIAFGSRWSSFWLPR
jgi:hypothetical protein